MNRRIGFDPVEFLPAVLLAAYLAGFVLTFGHESARYERAGDPYYFSDGAFSAAAWPVYWPLRWSWEAFR